jgi:hypothetical protein
MTLTRDITIQQGDTTKIITPVLDGDDPDRQFLETLDQFSIEATIAETFDSSSPLISVPSTNISVETFGSVPLGPDAFEDIEIIPDTQDVIVVSLPASTTASFIGGSKLVYQIRVSEASRGELTPVKGEIKVVASAPF